VTWVEADLEMAVNAAREAGVVVMKAFRTEQAVTHKSPDQPLTQADLAADALLRERLLSARPGYGWLSEETADTVARLQCERVWVVDPIDGTRSFIAGRAEFAISIGLAVAGESMLGVVYNPATAELFTALAGSGAHKEGGRLRLRATAARAVIAASRSEIARGEFDSFAERYDLMPTGSTAYKLGKVAEGRVDAFLSRGPKSEWDLCAGDLIVREAGGVVTDLSGAKLQYNREVPHIRGVLAAPETLHAAILQHVQESIA
jgi:myo-inositol-1(or 4)-monophosphatase